MYSGVVIMAVSLALPDRYRKIGFGVGLGLFLDEFIHLFHILGFTQEIDYWSPKSIITTALGVILIVVVLWLVKVKRVVV